RLKASFYGVRYPPEALKMLKKAKIKYKGWLPNFMVPEVFGKYRMTVHVPRRPYVESLPGIPTIRPFEALACGIPLICSPWNDSEHLFTPGRDYLVAANGEEMKKMMKLILQDTCVARSLIYHGINTIQRKHTCDHRADELMRIIHEIDLIRNRNIIHRHIRTEHK
ncbi:MAG TPA: glycosyltransferase, partial [Bacteroidales bacterium]|nr:glycosyltransferase [Bacteroidales bacterium]